MPEKLGIASSPVAKHLEADFGLCEIADPERNGAPRKKQDVANRKPMTHPQRGVDRLPRGGVGLIGKSLQPLDAGKERQHGDARVDLEVVAGLRGQMRRLCEHAGHVLTRRVADRQDRDA